MDTIYYRVRSGYYFLFFHFGCKETIFINIPKQNQKLLECAQVQVHAFASVLVQGTEIHHKLM